MIRLFRVYFPSRLLLLAALETILISAALTIAAAIWFGSDAELRLVYENGFAGIAVATGICVLCMYYHDLYNTMVIRNHRTCGCARSRLSGPHASSSHSFTTHFPQSGSTVEWSCSGWF